jgi:hypothetical protein
MIENNILLCLNKAHENIILSFLQDIQSIIDDITIKDEDYEGFINILAEIITTHNENGLKAYSDELFRDDWVYSLPNMVYWAALGYLSALSMEKTSLVKTISKLSNRLSITTQSIENMALIYPLYYDKTILN